MIDKIFKRKLLIYICIPIFVLILLIFISYITTNREWIGGFPNGLCRIYIYDEYNEPIKNCELIVFEKNTNKDITYKIFQDDNNGKLISNSDGIIVCNVIAKMRFGGNYWNLLWIIPIGVTSDDYDYDCILKHNRYKEYKFSIWELLKCENEYGYIEKIIDGEKIKQTVYQRKFILK